MPKILIADDNSNIQKMVALAFEDHKVEVVAVGNGEAAVKKLQDVKPDLILADVFMPVRNGYEVCEFVKRDARFSAIPVILLVGAFDPLDEIEAKRVSADGVLKKPFVPPDPLISMVMGLLAKNAKAAPAAKEEAPAEPPSLMPRRAQENPGVRASSYGDASADDDQYLMGKGRDADDEKWQTVTSARQESGPGFGVAGSVASETEERSYSETHAEARRRTELDHETVPSFSSALVGEMEEHHAEEQSSAEQRSVVPNPHAEAEAQPETNWAALVKSFTAAPLSISDLPPVVQKHAAEEEAAAPQGGAKTGQTSGAKSAAVNHAPALDHLIDQVNKRASENAAGQGSASAPVIDAPEERASQSSAYSGVENVGAAGRAESRSPKHAEEKNSSEAAQVQGKFEAAQAEAAVRPDALESSFDESVWAKVAMQTSLPVEPAAAIDYESRSETAAQMIAAAAEAAGAYSKRESGFPFAVQAEAGTAKAAAATPARVVEFRAAGSAAPAAAVAPATESATSASTASSATRQHVESAPSPREVPHFFTPVSEPGQGQLETTAKAEQASGAATEQPAATPNIDDIVARVMEKIAPQIQELISKGVLRPLVEEVLRQPETPKK